MLKLTDHISALMLALVLALGIGVVWHIAGMVIVLPFVERLAPSLLEEIEDYEILHVCLDGTPVVKSSKDGFHMLDGKSVSEDSCNDTLSGKELPDPKRNEKPFRNLNWRNRVNRIAVFSPDGHHQSWYAIHDGNSDGHVYFVGYNCDDRSLVGYIDRAGFRKDMPPENEQFCVDGREFQQHEMCFATMSRPRLRGFSPIEVGYLRTHDGLLKINFEQRTSEFVIRDANLYFMTKINEPLDQKSKRPQEQAEFLLLRNSDRVIYVDALGKTVRTYQLPSAIAQESLSWYECEAGKVIVVSPSDSSFGPLGRRSPGRYVVYWFGADGKVSRQQEVTLKGYNGPPASVTDDLVNLRGRDLDLAGCLLALIQPSPLGVCLMPYLNAGKRGGDVEDAEYQYSQTLQQLIDEAWLGFSILAAVCVVLAGLCCHRQRKYGQSWTLSWIVFVLLFGVPAYLGYLVHRKWPVRLACPNCGKLAPRDRPACFACGKDFPPPAAKGIEVFA